MVRSILEHATSLLLCSQNFAKFRMKTKNTNLEIGGNSRII